MITIGWWIGTTDWAYGNLAREIIKYLPQFNHVFNSSGDINIVMTNDELKRLSKENNKILHLDGNRWYEVFLCVN